MATNEEYMGFKLPKEDRQRFESKVSKRERSLVLRELVRLFNDGKVKVEVTKTFGGA